VRAVKAGFSGTAHEMEELCAGMHDNNIVRLKGETIKWE
jgi:phage replication-related protein YjqB (UPF0714/DUF867 family)